MRELGLGADRLAIIQVKLPPVSNTVRARGDYSGVTARLLVLGLLTLHRLMVLLQFGQASGKGRLFFLPSFFLIAIGGAHRDTSLSGCRSSGGEVRAPNEER